MPRSKKPVSQKQLAAKRANAARSTGPRTPEGKAHSARYSWKHGFAAAEFAVVRLEDLQAVAHLKTDLAAVFHPVHAQELFAIERIVLAQQALLRAARLETGLFTTCLPAPRIATTRSPKASTAWAEEFERLKALRDELPNEPIFEPQPEQKETTSTPFHTNPFPPESAEPAQPESEC